MNNYKKYAAIGGAVALAACWPLAVGQFAESTIIDAAKQLDKKEVSVEVVNYDRGYLNATAQTKITIVDSVLKQQLELDGLPTTLILNHQIHHGLFGVSSDTKTENYTEIPILIHSVTSFLGSTSVEVKSEKMTFNFAQDANSTLTFSPGTFNADISRDGQVKFDYQLDSFNGHFANGESLLLNSISGSGDGKKQQGFWIGQQNVGLGEINMLTPTGESAFNINQFNYRFNTKENASEATFSSQHHVSIDSIELEDDTLTDLGFDISFKDIGMEAFTQLLETYQAKSQALTSDDVKAITDNVDSLFEKGFTVSLNKMKATIRKGHFEGDWSLTVPKGDKKVSQNPMVILSMLEGETNAFISNDMAIEFPFIQAGLDNLIQQGVMLHKADGYHINGEIKEGNVEFKSGKKMPLFALLAPLFM